MPFALLRPPGAGTPPEAQAALSLLYGTSDVGTYHDVYEALVASGCVKEVSICVPCGGRGATARLGDGGRGAIARPSDGRAGTPCPPHPLLLGSHGDETADADLSQEMKDLMDTIMAKWPSPDRPRCRGRRRFACRPGAHERSRRRRSGPTAATAHTRRANGCWEMRSFTTARAPCGVPPAATTVRRSSTSTCRVRSRTRCRPSRRRFCRTSGADAAASMSSRRSCARRLSAIWPRTGSTRRAGRTSTACCGTSSTCRAGNVRAPSWSSPTATRGARTRR